MAKDLTKKEFNDMQTKIDKLKYKMKKILEQSDKGKISPDLKTQNRLDALNTIIGYLTRKGETKLPVHVLIEIANEIEREEL